VTENSVASSKNLKSESEKNKYQRCRNVEKITKWVEKVRCYRRRTLHSGAYNAPHTTELDL